MAWLPPQSRKPSGSPMHPLLKAILKLAIAVIVIPAVAYGLFLAAVLIYAALNGPIRWN